MAKVLLIIVMAGLALAPVLAQGQDQTGQVEGNSSGKKASAGRPAQQGDSKPKDSPKGPKDKREDKRDSQEPATPPAAGPGAPTVQPNPDLVPPEGPQVGISSEAEQPSGRQPTVPAQPGETAPAAADPELRQRIVNALEAEPNLTDAEVEVSADAKRITLTGTVGSWKDRRTVTRIAQSFAGDREVVDKLTIKSPSLDRQGE